MADTRAPLAALRETARQAQSGLFALLPLLSAMTRVGGPEARDAEALRTGLQEMPFPAIVPLTLAGARWLDLLRVSWQVPRRFSRWQFAAAVVAFPLAPTLADVLRSRPNVWPPRVPDVYVGEARCRRRLAEPAWPLPRSLNNHCYGVCQGGRPSPACVDQHHPWRYLSEFPGDNYWRVRRLMQCATWGRS